MDTGFAGRLRFRLGVERFVGGEDGAGGFVGAWTPGLPVWADMNPAGDHLLVEADGRASRPRFHVELRAGDLDRMCRLRFGARAFAVLSVTKDPHTPDRMGVLVEEVPV